MLEKRVLIKMAPMQQPTKTIVATSIGALLEWFDFTVYALLGPLLSTQLFDPKADGILWVYVFFAVSYFTRPLGSLLFGYFVDKRGRKNVLVFTMALMGISTALIGAIPNYSVIGIWAPIL